MTRNIILATSLILSLKGSVYAQWTQLPNLSQNVISVYVSNNNLLAGTLTGIYFSSDNGNSWNASSGITSSAKSFTKNGNKLLVSSYEKLFQSTNDGVSWSAMPTIYTNQAVNNVVISDTNYVVGMNGSGVWFSADNGTSWWSSSSSWSGKNTDITIKKNRLFASYHGSGYLQASNTNGQTWYTPSGNGIKIGLSSSFQDIYCLAVKNDSIIIAGTKNNGTYSQYDGVYFSYDDGNNWTKKINGITTTAMNSIAVVGNVIFVGTNGGGVFYSVDDGNNWVALNNGLSNLTINELYISGSTLFAGVSTGIFKIDICSLLKNTSTLNAIGSTTISSGDSLKLVANYSGIIYQWFLNDTMILNSNSNMLFANYNGNYEAIVSYSSYCYDTTNLISVIVNPTNGISNNLMLGSFLKLYPNPSNGTITFEYTGPNYSEPFEILIYNLAGSLIKSFPLLNNHSQLTLADWQTGVYYAVFRNRTITSQPQKLVVIK